MTDVVIKSPLQYLDKASSALRDMGLMPQKVEPAPINALLEKISDLDQDKIALIARTLGQTRSLQRGGARADLQDGGRRALPDHHQRLQLDPRRLQAPGRPGRRRQARHPGARHQHVDEDRARRHRRPLRQDPRHLSGRHQGDQEPDRARGQDPRCLSRLSRRVEARRGDGARGAEEGRREARCGEGRPEGGDREGGLVRRHRARRARQAGADTRRAAAPHAGRGQALPDRQGPVRQPDHLLQHLGGDHGAADADDIGQGARLCPGRNVLLHQRQRADGAEGLVHRHVRTARVDQDARCHEGRHVQEPGYAVGGRRQGHGSGRAQRLRPDHPRRRGQEAGRQRRQLPGTLHGDHRRDAQAVDAELGRDPRSGGRRQEAHGQADRRRRRHCRPPRNS